MSQSYRLKLERASLKLKVNARIPAQLEAEDFLTIDRANGVYTFGVDYTLIAETPVTDPSDAKLVVWDTGSSSFKLISISSLLSTGQTYQVITTGNCTVLDTDGLIIINKTVGAATAVTLPASASKFGPVKVVDFKGDAGTNNITVTPNGTEKFNGAAATWVIGADSASVVFDPILTGIGYAV